MSFYMWIEERIKDLREQIVRLANPLKSSSLALTLTVDRLKFRYRSVRDNAV
jgi:hypothetical protein